MARKDIKYDIRSFDLNDYSDFDKLLKFGKRAAQFVNRRLNALEKANLRTTATTGGIRNLNVRQIKTKRSAVRAINKARQMVANPLSTPGSVKRLYREAAKEFGSPQGTRMKIIAVEEKVYDENGRWTGTMKLVPKAVPYGTNKDSMSWKGAVSQIKSFWNWYHDQMEQWLASDEAQQMWEESSYNAKVAKSKALEHPLVKSFKASQQASDEISKIMRKSDWLTK